MGNKNSGIMKGPGSQREEEELINAIAGSVSRDGAATPGPELLASLQTLGENKDYTLLPLCLHRMAESFGSNGDYSWAIQFLQLEKLYHQRLLSNLTVLQENWESQWRDREAERTLPADADIFGQKHIEALREICRTHLQPAAGPKQKTRDAALNDFQREETLLSFPEEGGSPGDPEMAHLDEDKVEGLTCESEVEGENGETYEEGQEVEEEEPCEDTPEEEEVKVEWPAGVPQASDKDLAKLSHAEGSSSPDGLVSILKRRRASLDGLPPPGPAGSTQSSKRKVRFSEPDDGAEQDEVGGDSCLVLLLLCLVTVVISVGGTALYCTLVDTYSNICTDFTLKVDFYVTSVRRLLDGLGLWLPPRT